MQQARVCTHSTITESNSSGSSCSVEVTSNLLRFSKDARRFNLFAHQSIAAVVGFNLSGWFSNKITNFHLLTFTFSRQMRNLIKSKTIDNSNSKQYFECKWKKMLGWRWWPSPYNSNNCIKIESQIYSTNFTHTWTLKLQLINSRKLKLSSNQCSSILVFKKIYNEVNSSIMTSSSRRSCLLLTPGCSYMQPTHHVYELASKQMFLNGNIILRTETETLISPKYKYIAS